MFIFGTLDIVFVGSSLSTNWTIAFLFFFSFNTVFEHKEISAFLEVLKAVSKEFCHEFVLCCENLSKDSLLVYLPL